MATTASWLSREQTAQDDFLREVSQLKAFAGELETPAIGKAIDALAAATSRFGSCELQIRRAERLGVVGVSPDEAATLTKRGLKANEGGLEALNVFRAFIDELGKTTPDEGAQKRWKSESAEVRRQWSEQIAQVDAGAADTTHLMDMTRQCFDAIDAGGPTGLAGYLQERVSELEEVRRTPERGTWANSFPWWKIVAAAIWLGVTAFAIWRAVTFGAAWWDVAMIVFIALIGTILIALGC